MGHRSGRSEEKAEFVREFSEKKKDHGPGINDPEIAKTVMIGEKVWKLFNGIAISDIKTRTCHLFYIKAFAG